MDIKKSKKNLKFTTIAWIMAAMLLVIIIPLNIVVSLFDVKLDLTENNLYSLTDSTKKYLSGLDKKIDFYFLMDMETLKSDDSSMALSNILEEYSKYDCINFVDVDPETHPEIRDELNPNGYMTLSNGDMVLRCGEHLKRIPGNTMYRNLYDDDGNVIGETFNGENYITGAIKSVVEGIMPSVYFLTGHGEKTIENDYTRFRQLLENYNYRAKELNLSIADAVPEDAAIIIAAAPKTDIADSEKAKIESFMDRGGNLSLLMSPNDSDKNYDNLDDIMHRYGIGMEYNIISETDSSKHVSGNENQIMVNLVDVSSLDDENIVDLTSSVIDLTNKISIPPFMPASRSFYQYQSENISDLTVCPLIETYDSAVGTPYGGEDIDPDKIAGLLYLAAYSKDRTRNDSKLVVMGNAEFIDDENFSDDDFVIVPVMLYLNTITWMYNSDIDMNIEAKSDKSDYMTLKSKEDTNAMMIILNIAPAIVAVSGIFIWLKRRHA